MENLKVYAVIGAGYGDEGKGLMTDYFCEKSIGYGKTLNVKVNGGAQAGHTVCRLSGEPSYNRFVFHSIGAGTFAGADTHFGQKFLVNCQQVVDELDIVEQYFRYKPHTSIDPYCRLSLTADVELNRLIENTRTNRHGSCGLGIFETVHRNHSGFGLNIHQLISCQNDDERITLIHKITKEYLLKRIVEILDKENLVFNLKKVEELDNSLLDYAKNDVESFNHLLSMKNISIETLSDRLKYGYTDLVFECSQGLELDWRNERNFPHTTGSHTGLKNIVKEINKLDTSNWLSFEICYVTRSYKTKHGDGFFYEEDNSIKDKYSLYDRTNIHNKYQGTLQFGKLDLDRLQMLIKQDLSLLNNIESPLSCPILKSLSVTHLDQTSEGVLTKNGDIYFTELNSKKFIDGEKTYYSFGEKNTDIIVV